MLDEAGEPLCAIIKGDCEVREALPIFLIPRWAFCDTVFIVHPLLKYCNVGLEPLDFLPMDIISDPDGGGESGNNGPGDRLGVTVRMFCTEVGERGNPQESVVVRAILAPSSVTLPTQRALFWPRLRCPGKQLVVCSGDEMHIGMGKGAEDETMAGDSPLDRSTVDIVNGPQV